MPELTDEQRAYATQMQVVNLRLQELATVTEDPAVVLALQAVVDAWEKLMQMRFFHDGLEWGPD